MTRNPHEIVTLDDQPDNEGPSRYLLACGCALDGPEYHCPNCERLLGMCTCKPDPGYITKPMRIRCMELPGEINPNTNELTTPFVIVIDRVTGDDIQDWHGKAIALNTGARGVLVFEQEIQIGDDPE